MKAFPTPRAVASYHPGLRTIHWLMAALIFVALPLGVWASLLPGGDATRVKILFFHKSIGVTVFGLIALRIVWPVARKAGIRKNRPNIPIEIGRCGGLVGGRQEAPQKRSDGY